MNKIRYERGAVLIISLIMLLLLTLIGVSGSQVTGLEEKMAGNTRDENLAFQAAESALRAGENIVRLNPPSFSVGNNGTGGLYTTVGASASYWDTINWSSSTAVANYNAGSLSHVTSAPHYIIEELPTTASTGSTTNTGGSLEAGTPSGSQSISWYRITGRGTGGSDNTVAMVQSIYRR